MDNDMLINMFKLQDKLNTLINPNWREERTLNDWRTAIFVEGAELIDSLPWKWWKYKDGIDKENIFIEIVDIWHFGISALLNRKAIEDIEKELNSSYVYNNVKAINDINDLIEKTITEITYLCNYLKYENEGNSINIMYVLNRLYNLTKIYGLEFEEVYKVYVMKNVLNIFRQDNGYNNGTYKKIWSGKEDNMVAKEILDKLIEQEVSLKDIPEILYQELEKSYKNHKILL